MKLTLQIKEAFIPVLVCFLLCGGKISSQFQVIFKHAYPERIEAMDSILDFYYRDYPGEFKDADDKVKLVIEYVKQNGDSYDHLYIRRQRLNSIYTSILRRGKSYTGFAPELIRLLPESRQYNFKELEAQILNLLGQYYFIIENNYRLAFENLIKSREIYKTLDADEFPIIKYGNYVCASIFYEFNDFHTTLEICKEIELEKNLEPYLKILIYDLMAECYANLSNPDSSKYYLEKIIHTAAAEKNYLHVWIGIATGKLGINWYRRGELKNAESMLLTGLESCSKPGLNLSDNISVFAAFLSKVYLGMNNLPSAYKYARLSGEAVMTYDRSPLQQKLKSYRFHMAYHKAIAEYYRTTGEYQKALRHMDTSGIYKDKIQYHVDVSEKFNAQLAIKQEKDKQREQMETGERQKEIFIRNSLLTIVGLLIFVFTFLFSWLRLLHKNKNEKILAENKFKEKQLELEHQFRISEVEKRKFLEMKNEIIEKSLSEKDLLLREIHHRVKNNLQIISSLFDLQGNRLTEKSARIAIADAKGRVMSIALIHQQLHQKDILGLVEIDPFVRELCNQVCAGVKPRDLNINFNYSIDTVRLNIDTAIPLGLILNELLTNSFKYAFNKHSEGNIRIELKVKQAINGLSLEENTSTNHLDYLIYWDSGSGFPSGFNLNDTQSLGLKLVMQLAKQIKCRLEYHYNQGAEFRFKF